jgi:hypothetical protein
MFTRGAGANEVFKGANNTPYDGGDIGAFIADAIRNFSGSVTGCNVGIFLSPSGAFRVSSGAYYTAAAHASIFNSAYSQLQFSTSNIGTTFPVAHENRSASVSVLVCITY